jgi:hypothetical protein
MSRKVEEMKTRMTRSVLSNLDVGSMGEYAGGGKPHPYGTGDEPRFRAGINPAPTIRGGGKLRAYDSIFEEKKKVLLGMV